MIALAYIILIMCIPCYHEGKLLLMSHVSLFYEYYYTGCSLYDQYHTSIHSGINRLSSGMTSLYQISIRKYNVCVVKLHSR